METGYKNTGYKKILAETFLYVPLLILPFIRTCFSTPDDVLITVFHCLYRPSISQVFFVLPIDSSGFRFANSICTDFIDPLHMRMLASNNIHCVSIYYLLSNTIIRVTYLGLFVLGCLEFASLSAEFVSVGIFFPSN